MVIVVIAAFMAVVQSATPPAVPVNIAEVKTGGQWFSAGQHGYFRVIVERHGFEHISSKVFLEWITEPSGPNEGAKVVREAEINEAGVSGCSLGIVKLDGNKLVLDGGSSYSAVSSCRLEFSLGKPGSYRAVR